MTIEEIESILKRSEKSRFNIKLMLVNNYDLTISIKQIFDRNNYKIQDLKEFQKNDDEWFGVSKLTRIIKEISQPTILFSVSEVIRFYNDEDFRSFFNAIFGIENKGYDIYIPLFGLENRFRVNFYNSFYRRDEFDFFYKIISEYQKITLYIVNFNVSYPNRLDTISDWLGFYNNHKNNLICSPRPLVERICNQSNDDLITIKSILNEKDFLEKYLEKSFPIAYDENNKELWQKLIEDLENISLKELIQRELNLNQLSPIEIINKVCSRINNQYLKWLLKGYALEYLNDESYFSIILKNANIDEPLIDKVWFHIFDNFNVNYLDERFELLTNFYKNNTPKPKIEEKLREFLSNIQIPESFITGITVIEKELIIKLFNENKFSQIQLEKVYPDLVYYLNDIEFENNINWIKEYFKEYKFSKLKHQPTEKLNELLKQQNGSKELFFKWYEDLRFKELYHFSDLINYKKLWVDGLGIEWVGFIKSYIESNYDYKVECFLSKSKLPSKTECNRFKDIEKIETLDEYIHKQTNYKYPLNLIQEIEIIKEIIHQNIDEDLLIVSDHGFSAFCGFKSKTNSFNNDDHEGRCAKIDTLIEDINYFSHNFDCGRYLVALNHNSLNHKTRREAHGGATPEEVIVPIIKISKKTISKIQQEVKKPVKETKGFVEKELF